VDSKPKAAAEGRLSTERYPAESSIGEGCQKGGRSAQRPIRRARRIRAATFVLARQRCSPLRTRLSSTSSLDVSQPVGLRIPVGARGDLLREGLRQRAGPPRTSNPLLGSAIS
jgi:hypothetical protein